MLKHLCLRASCNFDFYFTDCPLFVIKPVKLKPLPAKRSVRLTWVYDPDPEDKSFIFEVVGIAKKELNITTREYVFRGLGKY